MNQRTDKAPRRKLSRKLALVLLSTLLGLAMAEVASRFWQPISPGSRVLAADGSRIRLDSSNPYRLRPGLTVRNISSEFDVTVTTCEAGHRVPCSTQPEVIFVGDSFTFGRGLADHETFAYLYAEESGRACVNLGRSGTGTLMQMNILEHFLQTEEWQPREIKLFMMVMSSAFMAGNDFADTLDELRRSESEAATAAVATGVNSTPNAEERDGGARVRIQSLRKLVLGNSNLARVVYFQFGPQIRSLLSPKPEAARLQAALNATTEQLERLEGLAQRHGFAYEIYVLHPVQDLMRGTADHTSAVIREHSPRGEASVVPTAQLFMDEPPRYYYAYDGHFNPAGSRKVADLLLERDR